MAKKSSEEKPKDKDEANKTSAPTSPPVFDVSKPGETAASPTSRPIIVSHKSILKKDPMMSADEDKPDDEKEKEAPLRPKREAKLEPPSAEEKKPEAEKESPEPAPASDENPKEEEPADNAPESSDAGAIDALAGETSTKKEQQKAEEEAAKKKAEVDKLIASKKYYLPIHDTAYGGSNAFTWFINSLLVILLLAAGAILAHDAGYIDLGLDLPFDLIE